MKPEPLLLGRMGMSIGGDSIPFTTQAKGSRMAIEDVAGRGREGR